MATLKICDLSVGDWVMCNGFKATIAGYNAESGSIQVLTKQKNKMWFGLDDIEPIPITAEILEANGIHKTYEDDNYTIFRGDRLWAVKYSYGDWELSTPPVCRVDIKYVHQLQHALRLTGIDKEINL